MENKMNTKIEYLYRNASNYKVQNQCIIQGALTETQMEAILDCLDSGEFFIPSQVGLPEKRFDKITEDDHPWFELNEDGFSLTDEPATVDMTAEKLVEEFKEAAGNWNDGTDIYATYDADYKEASEKEQIDPARFTDRTHFSLCFDRKDDGTDVVCLDLVYDDKECLSVCDVENITTMLKSEYYIFASIQLMQHLSCLLNIPIQYERGLAFDESVHWHSLDDTYCISAWFSPDDQCFSMKLEYKLEDGSMGPGCELVHDESYSTAGLSGNSIASTLREIAADAGITTLTDRSYYKLTNEIVSNFHVIDFSPVKKEKTPLDEQIASAKESASKGDDLSVKTKNLESVRH